MGLTNFVLTVAGVSAVVLLLRSDVKQSASIFRRNVKQIRNWLEEETATSSKGLGLDNVSIWVSMMMNQSGMLSSKKGQLLPTLGYVKISWALSSLKDMGLEYRKSIIFSICEAHGIQCTDLRESLELDLLVTGLDLSMEKATPKELESKVPPKDMHKEDKH
ncbi:unnamed protein product [Sphenostylis stenocarpa]|uniref:Uncharacterized protein n=1 Tax=Sphenostylis stenocarpa TaxID=92480 RepID=A0AA86RL70_9FABA|nr:unnamed protein product [Sphenostylis stenocarpa]